MFGAHFPPPPPPHYWLIKQLQKQSFTYLSAISPAINTGSFSTIRVLWDEVCIEMIQNEHISVM